MSGTDTHTQTQLLYETLCLFCSLKDRILEFLEWGKIIIEEERLILVAKAPLGIVVLRTPEKKST